MLDNEVENTITPTYYDFLFLKQYNFKEIHTHFKGCEIKGDKQSTVQPQLRHARCMQPICLRQIPAVKITNLNFVTISDRTEKITLSYILNCHTMSHYWKIHDQQNIKKTIKRAHKSSSFTNIKVRNNLSISLSMSFSIHIGLSFDVVHTYVCSEQLTNFHLWSY